MPKLKKSKLESKKTEVEDLKIGLKVEPKVEPPLESEPPENLMASLIRGRKLYDKAVHSCERQGSSVKLVDCDKTTFLLKDNELEGVLS